MSNQKLEWLTTALSSESFPEVCRKGAIPARRFSYCCRLMVTVLIILLFGPEIVSGRSISHRMMSPAKRWTSHPKRFPPSGIEIWFLPSAWTPNRLTTMLRPLSRCCIFIMVLFFALGLVALHACSNCKIFRSQFGCQDVTNLKIAYSLE